MQPPVPAENRETSELGVVDAEILAGPGARSVPVISHVSKLDVTVNARRSERGSGGVALERVLDVVAPLVSATAEWVAADGYIERQTLIPSAGARHPFTALVLARSAGDGDHEAWAVSPSTNPHRYKINRRDVEVAHVLRATADALRLADPPSTAVILLARFQRTLSKYPDGHSLVWRDSGVFLGAAHLLAVSLGIRSCIVGIAGTTSFALEGTGDTLDDVGALVLSEKE